MNSYLKPGTGVICLVLLTVVMIIASAGCTDAVEERQSGSTSAGNIQTGHTAPNSTAAGKNITVPSSPHTTGPLSVPVSATGILTIDPVADKNTGEKFTLTGTTGLPSGTVIFWQILPDTGSPPAGLDGSSMMSVGGNYLVTPGEGTKNRIAIAVDLGRLVPGRYAAIVGKAKEQEPDRLDWEIGKDYGYTYFTLK
jgi:hypothetical protein